MTSHFSTKCNLVFVDTWVYNSNTTSTS